MKKTVFFCIGWCIVIILVAVIIIKSSMSFLANGTIILGWLLFMIQLTWNYSEPFYMFIKRAWFFIKNPDCIWNMQVEFVGDFNIDTFNKIEEMFRDSTSDLKVIKLSNLRRLYKINTLTFEIVIDNTNNIFRLDLSDLEVSYRRSRRLIDYELGEILEKLSRILKEDESKYYFNIGFKEVNPYYGFFIRRLKLKDINTFNVKFNVENDKVTVNKQSIEFYTTSLQKLNSFSKEYLTLSPR
ncbi:hypothetical protein [Virgibacillus sp. Bac330]|uniref:hypothetical protein n=1 Tax=Virgibacillus sp. Bac330 TaxID=2419841 RepID=UPI000EF4AD1A|nr:hypothetical protein [Virgibacillus sp. Bac330]